MSRSGPPRSRIVARLRRGEQPASSGPPARRSLGRRLRIQVVHLALWLHIYLSMFGLAAVLFFSVTGLTLNHPDWFAEGAEQRATFAGRVEPRWLRLAVPEAAVGGVSDAARGVARLEVVEHLRRAHGVRGALAEFTVEEDECIASFRGPGYAADAFLDRNTGRYDLTVTEHGLVALLNDLHKGRDTGPAWSVVIDLAAVVLTVISLTGLLLLCFLRLRRAPGLWVAGIGTLVLILVWRLWVP